MPEPPALGQCVILSMYRPPFAHKLCLHKPFYSSLPRSLRFIHTFLSKQPSHGPWRHLLHFPASPVLLLSSRSHVCYHYVFSRDIALWFAIYHLLVRGLSCVCPPYNLMLPLTGKVLEGGDALTSEQHSSFIGGGFVATLLLLISIVGYVSHVSVSHPY